MHKTQQLEMVMERVSQEFVLEEQLQNCGTRGEVGILDISRVVMLKLFLEPPSIRRKR